LYGRAGLGLGTFSIFVWTILRVERSLDAEGGSPVYTWRVPSTRKEAHRNDGVLATSIRRRRTKSVRSDDQHVHCPMISLSPNIDLYGPQYQGALTP
jgi:hypothetical protein